MSDGEISSGGIEEAFARVEVDAEAALKAAATVTRQLKRFHTATRQGNVRDLQGAADAARQSIAALDQAVTRIGESWSFDEESYLRSGDYSAELIARAAQTEVRITELDNRLYSYPVLLRIVSGERMVLVDKTRERRLRPSFLIGLLKEMQRRPRRFRAGDFLNSLATAYEVALKQQPNRSAGAVVPLVELYELLTMLPGQARDYSKQEFARDIYLLDQSGETQTREGAHIEFHAGAGARTPRGSLTIVTQQGAERKYHGVAFIKP
jgi:hypothetical protein